MLHSRFSELKLQEVLMLEISKPEPEAEKDTMNMMELGEEEPNCVDQQKHTDGCFLVPNSSTHLRLNSLKKNIERMKQFKTPTPSHSSPSKCFDQNNENVGGFEAESWKKIGSNAEISPLVYHSNRTSMSANTSRGKPLLSEELSKLCSNSPMYAFNSDSDNSSCLFANDSFLSSADFTDDVFDDGTISLFHSKPSQSYTEYSDRNEKCRYDVDLKLSANFAKFENYVQEKQTEVSKGAAIAGSPSKIRHKNQRAVRRIKSSSSFRFSPLQSSPRKAKTQKSGTRWYKAPTDSRLYEVRRRELREFSHAASDAITLPRTRRALQFGECDSKPDPQDLLVEKAKAEIHAELPTIRTDTPESGYGSLNSSRQTPDLPQGDTPVARFSSRLPFPTAEYVPSPTSYKVNICAVPWLQKFDIISRLYRMAPLLVHRIFTYLEPRDLVLFSSVSRQWRMICSSHPLTKRIRDHYIKTQEKAFQIRKENLGSSSKIGRKVTGPGTPLSSVQCLDKPSAASTPAKETNFDKFLQLRKQLKEGEMLEKCKCGSPARIETKTRKASCSSSICQYEFCIKCKMGYHGNSPCVTSSGSRRARGPSVGSKKSKSSLRRSSRLSSND